MLLILVYWFYLFFVTATLGNSLVHNIIREKVHPAITPILGLFVVTILGSIYAIFDCLSFKFEIGLLILSLICNKLYYRSFLDYCCLFKKTFQKFSIFPRVLFISIFILALAQSATAPYLIDNESYYLPTIKWLDNYGFTPGLANLHIFLGQISGWHISQSALNLDFIYSEFNDINGFILILGNFYVIDKLNDYFIKRDLYLLILGLFPLFNVLLFQFVSSPSPDLPIYVLSLIIFGEYSKSVQTKSFESNIIVFTLVIFAIFIKVTSILFLIFPIVIFISNKSQKRKEFYIAFLMSMVVGSLFILKNIIISGYPLYPLSWLSPSDIDWQLPKHLLEYFITETKLSGYIMTDIEYENSSNFDLFIHWLSLPKLHGLFNLYMAVLLLLFPVIFYFTKYRKTLIIIYAISLLQMVLLWISSPQYRFYLAFLIIMTIIWLGHILSNRIKLIKIIISLSFIVIAFPLFLNIDMNSFTSNKFHLSLDNFAQDYLLIPHPKTKYKEAVYETFQSEDTIIYTPLNIDFYWAVGDSPLPGLQKQQYDYFKHYFKVIPVMRSRELKDGFYSKEIPPD